jgi:hypothetical protein
VDSSTAIQFARIAVLISLRQASFSQGLAQGDVKAELLRHLHSDANIRFGIVMAILGAQSVVPQSRCRWRSLGEAAVQFSRLADRVLTVRVPNVLTIAISNSVGGVRVPHVRDWLVSA